MNFTIIEIFEFFSENIIEFGVKSAMIAIFSKNKELSMVENIEEFTKFKNNAS